MATSLTNTEVVATINALVAKDNVGAYLGDTTYTNKAGDVALPADIIAALQTAEGDSYAAVANPFLSALVNKFAFQRVENMEWTNPFHKFEGRPITYGEAIENIFIDRATGVKDTSDSSTSEDSPFVKTIPNVQSMYTQINYKIMYPLSVEKKVLKRAVMSEYGLTDIIDGLAHSLIVGRDVDEYLATIVMLNNADIYAHGFETVDVSGAETTAAQMKTVTETIIQTYKDMLMPSKDNNKKGVMNVSSKNNLYLVIKQELLNKIDLDYLTGVYNLSKVDLLQHIIPVRSFKTAVKDANDNDIVSSINGEDIDFVIVDERGFDIHTALNETGSIYNPRNMRTNLFTHLWKVIAFRHDFQARAFVVDYGE